MYDQVPTEPLEPLPLHLEDQVVAEDLATLCERLLDQGHLGERSRTAASKMLHGLRNLPFRTPDLDVSLEILLRPPFGVGRDLSVELSSSAFTLVEWGDPDAEGAHERLCTYLIHPSGPEHRSHSQLEEQLHWVRTATEQALSSETCFFFDHAEERPFSWELVPRHGQWEGLPSRSASPFEQAG